MSPPEVAENLHWCRRFAVDPTTDEIANRGEDVQLQPKELARLAHQPALTPQPSAPVARHRVREIDVPQRVGLIATQLARDLRVSGFPELPSHHSHPVFKPSAVLSPDAYGSF